MTAHLLDGVPTVIHENLGYRHQYVPPFTIHLLTVDFTSVMSSASEYWQFQEPRTFCSHR
jgi:hypothetical protein